MSYIGQIPQLIGNDPGNFNGNDYVLKIGDTMTGSLVLPIDPINNLEAATKQYVDNRSSVLISGTLHPVQLKFNDSNPPAPLYLWGTDATGSTTYTYPVSMFSGNGNNGNNLVTSVAGRIGDIILSVSDISGAAPLVSPNFSQIPTAPTASPSTSTTQIATTAFVQTAIAGLSGNGGGAVTSVAGRVGAVTLSVSDVSGAAPLASPSFSGTPTAPTPAQGTNNTQIATTEFVKNQGYLTTNLAASSYLPLAGGSMVGPITMPADPTTSMQVATKQYVDNKLVPSFQKIIWTDYIDVATTPYLNVYATVKTHSFTAPSKCSIVKIDYRMNCHHSGTNGKSTEWKLLLNGTQISYGQSNANGGDNMVFWLPMGSIANVTPNTTYTLTLQAKTYGTGGNIWTNGGQNASSDVPMGQSEIDLLFF